MLPSAEKVYGASDFHFQQDNSVERHRLFASVLHRIDAVILLKEPQQNIDCINEHAF